MNILSLIIKEFIYFTNLNNRIYQFILFVQPLVLLTIIHFMSVMKGIEITGPYIIATAIVSMWSYVLYSSGSSLIWQKWNDSLNLLIAAPVSLFQIVLSKMLSNSLIAFISLTLTLFYAKIIFSLNIGIAHLGTFIFTAIVLLVSLSVVGMFLAVVFTTVQEVYSFQNFILTPVILLSGIFIPVESLPFTFRIISYLLPMTWAVESIYSGLNETNDVFLLAGVSLGSSFIYLFILFFGIRRMEKIMKQSGSLGVV
ncbi:ABC transporter permease [Mesobacillus zeae]|uniref:ABC transporter permease n=1 Tax=Mesobacillus zeae TaxID=1917180 RepID=UPI0015E66433|nr:ABC transporter permease [Mesobacillus zeae]